MYLPNDPSVTANPLPLPETDGWAHATCSVKTEVYSRVAGYYRPVKCWNKGKREEFRLRKPFRISEKNK